MNWCGDSGYIIVPGCLRNTGKQPLQKLSSLLHQHKSEKYGKICNCNNVLNLQPVEKVNGKNIESEKTTGITTNSTASRT